MAYQQRVQQVQVQVEHGIAVQPIFVMEVLFFKVRLVYQLLFYSLFISSKHFFKIPMKKPVHPTELEHHFFLDYFEMISLKKGLFHRCFDKGFIRLLKDQ